MMRAGLPGSRELHLSLGLLQQRLVQRERRLQDLLHRRDARRARELQEQLVQVFAHRLVAGEQAVVRVDARGVRMVVAGAAMAVAAQLATLASHDHVSFACVL